MKRPPDRRHRANSDTIVRLEDTDTYVLDNRLWTGWLGWLLPVYTTEPGNVEARVTKRGPTAEPLKYPIRNYRSINHDLKQIVHSRFANQPNFRCG